MWTRTILPLQKVTFIVTITFNYYSKTVKMFITIFIAWSALNNKTITQMYCKRLKLVQWLQKTVSVLGHYKPFNRFLRSEVQNSEKNLGQCYLTKLKATFEENLS